MLKKRTQSEVEINHRHYTVRIARSKRDRVQALALRYQVFHREYIGKQFPIGIDTDRFDRNADFLVIIDNRIKRVVGSYRFICSSRTDQFYSATEFDIESFLSRPGVKVELSRACVHRNYRTGTVIHLLWRGIAEYMKAKEAAFLFGCSSILTKDIESLHTIYKFLSDKKALADNLQIQPKGKYRIEDFHQWKTRFESSDPLGEQLTVPPLLRSYLKAGAQVYLEPALDRKFKCFDFFTVLEVDALSGSYEKKYIAK